MKNISLALFIWLVQNCLAVKNYGPGARVSRPVVASSIPATTIVPSAVAVVPSAVAVVPSAVAAVEPQTTADVLYEPIVVDTRSLEEVIQQQAESQARGIAERQKQLTLLQSQLTKSIAKKEEIEDVISREINGLRARIQDIEASELAGLGSLREVLTSLRGSAESKNALITDSKAVVAQLKEVRNKIAESTILSLLESSIDQKQALVDIERDICADIYSLIFEVEIEIERVQFKLKEINKILKSFPVGEDREAARKYSWSDVETFQKQLLASTESSINGNSKIGDFSGRLNAVMQRRGILLGETPLPRVLSDAVKVVANKSIAQSSFVKPSVNPSLSISELSMKLEKQDDNELKNVATDALKKTVKSLVSSLASFTGASASALATDEFAESKKAGSLGLNAIKDAGVGIRSAYESLSFGLKETMDSLPNGIESEDYIGTVSGGIKTTLASPVFKSSIASISEGTQKFIQEYATAFSLLTGAIGSKLSDSSSFTRSSSETIEALKVLLVSVTILGSRQVQVITKSNRLLPPPSS